MKLRQELQITMDDVNEKLKILENDSNRYTKARATIMNILKESGIKIQGLKDL